MHLPEPASTDIVYVPSHSSSAAAAIAIPLSLVAAILLGALLLLLFRARRSGQRERDKEKQYQMAREAESSLTLNNMSFASATDLERAVLALSANRAYGSAASFTHGPPPMDIGRTYAGHGLGAATAALGRGAFGWGRGFGPAAPTVPPISDAYTPAPVLRHATGSSARSISRPQSMYGYEEQEKFRGAPNWLEPNWHSSQQTLADGIPRYYSGPPQLPAIQTYASFSTAQADVLPPLPPKQLFPGRLDIHAPRAYTPPYGSSLVTSETSLPPTPRTEVHSSLNVISDYMQASPASPQLQDLCPNEQASELPAPRVPPPSLLRAQSIRRLETLPEREENNKPLPIQPENSGGSNLYGAVSKAIGAWRS